MTGSADQTVRLVLPRAALWRRPRYLVPASAVTREAAGGEVLGDDCGPQ